MALVNSVNGWLFQYPLFHTFHGKAIHIIPEGHFLFEELLILKDCQINARLVRKEHSSFFQPMVSSPQNRIQHGLVNQEVPHPFGDNYIHFSRQLDLFDQSMKHCDSVLHVVLFNDFPAKLANIRLFNSVYTFGPSLHCEHAKNTCPTTKIQYYLFFEDLGVVNHCLHVGFGSDLVLDHFLVDIEVSVGVKVVILAALIRVGLLHSTISISLELVGSLIILLGQQSHL